MGSEEYVEDGYALEFVIMDGVAVPTRYLFDPRNGDGLVLDLDLNTEKPKYFNFTIYFLNLNINFSWCHLLTKLNVQELPLLIGLSAVKVARFFKNIFLYKV